MKKILSLTGILSILMMFNACSEQESTVFDFGGKNYWSFHAAKQTIEASENGKSVVYLYHLNSAAITPVNIAVKYGEGSENLFKVTPASAGSVDESSKLPIEITYDVSQVQFNTPYKLTVSIPQQQEVYPVRGKDSLINNVEITIIRSLTFTELGVGALTSEWLMEDDVPVKIAKAKEANIYKVMAPYGKGYDMLISVNGNVATVAAQQLDLVSGAAPLIVSGSGTFANGEFELTLDFIMYYPANTVYYQELGNLEVITLPGQ